MIIIRIQYIKLTTMKICVLFFVCLLAQTVLYAQNNTSYGDVSKKFIFYPIRQQLTKDNRYTLNMPQSLSYHRGEEEIEREIWNPFTSFLPIQARLHQVKGDYLFDILTTGLSGLNGQPARWYRTEVEDQNRVPREVKGYVRDFTCRFPCVLRVRNRDGETLDSIVLAGKDEVFTVTMHRDFLLAANRPEAPKAAMPYLSEKELSDAEMLYRDALAKKAEQMVAYKVFAERLWLAMNFLYNQYNTQKQDYGWGYVKPKNRKYDFTDLDNAIVQYRVALDSLEKGNRDACKAICSGLKATYMQMLNSNEERVDKNVKQILYYNLSYVSLLSWDYADAKRYYDLFIGSGVPEGAYVASQLRSRMELFKFYDDLKAQCPKKS